MKRLFELLTLLGVVSCLALITGCGDSSQGKSSPAVTDESGRKVLFYKSPMDPSFVSKNPGKDGMGMDLVPVYVGDPAANLDNIEVNGATMQKMGVRLEPVKRGELTRIVRALGRVAFDEERVAAVNMKFDGWIEKLFVNETGQHVKEGDPLFAIYSPELVASQKEYLQVYRGVAKGPHTEHLKRAARERLIQFDIPEEFIREIEKSGEAKRQVVIKAPKTGFVVHKNAFEGTYVKEGTNLFTVADLDELWVLADVYEFDAPWVSSGQTATIELDYLPGHLQEAKVDYVYPTLSEKTRTVEVRLILPNPKVSLRPGMFATVRIKATPVGNTLLVPVSAVIHSGERNIAFVQRGEGLFEPRELELGVRGNESYQVLSGLKEGEMLVTSGQFLLDSESRLKESAKKMLGSNVKKEMSTKMPMENADGGMKGMEMHSHADDAAKHGAGDAK